MQIFGGVYGIDAFSSNLNSNLGIYYTQIIIYIHMSKSQEFSISTISVGVTKVDTFLTFRYVHGLSYI